MSPGVAEGFDRAEITWPDVDRDNPNSMRIETADDAPIGPEMRLHRFRWVSSTWICWRRRSRRRCRAKQRKVGDASRRSTDVARPARRARSQRVGKLINQRWSRVRRQSFGSVERRVGLRRVEGYSDTATYRSSASSPDSPSFRITSGPSFFSCLASASET